MRRIICRFDNKEALDDFKDNTGLCVYPDCKKFFIETREGIRAKRLGFYTETNRDNTWEKYWINMPDFKNKEVCAYARIEFYTEKSNQELSEMFKQTIRKDTKSIRYPKADIHAVTNIRVVGNAYKLNYPIYVVSKGRYDLTKCLTVRHLNLMEVNHYIVVEPQEYDLYQAMIDSNHLKYSKLLKLDMSYKDNYDTLDSVGDGRGKGPGGARNFCWEHSKSLGYKYHWVMDDNIDGFKLYTRNYKLKTRAGSAFNIVEDFFTRFKNVGMFSLNYAMFIDHLTQPKGYTLNTRMYSCMFIRNDIPFRWRGRYNEDTIISLDLLTHGWCTLELNSFLAEKVATQRIKGGNTAEFYSKDGTGPKTEMLIKVYPQYSKQVYKFHRIHHYVDYSSFTMPLEYTDSAKLKYGTNENTYSTVNNHGLYLVRIPAEWNRDLVKDTNSYIQSHLDECDILSFDDITNKSLMTKQERDTLVEKETNEMLYGSYNLFSDYSVD